MLDRYRRARRTDRIAGIAFTHGLAWFVAKDNEVHVALFEHAFAFAYVDYLLAKYGGAKFRDLLRIVKARKKPCAYLMQRLKKGRPSSSAVLMPRAKNR